MVKNCHARAHDPDPNRGKYPKARLWGWRSLTVTSQKRKIKWWSKSNQPRPGRGPSCALSILSRGTTTRPAARAGTVNFCPKETWLFKLYLGNIFKTSPIRKHRFFSILSRYVVMRARIYDTNTQNNNTISDCVGWWNLANPQGPRNNNCFNILKKLRLDRVQWVMRARSTRKY